MSAISLTCDLPKVDMAIACLLFSGVEAEATADFLQEPIAILLETRSHPLEDEVETIRLACRDMLRNGKYKPTGRGKPACEYLLKAARTGSFPRISSAVDICNLISLRWMIPISLADLDRCNTESFLFRLGLPGESFIFNRSGQSLGLEDMVVGCAVSPGQNSLPLVSPIKDSMAAKTTPESANFGAFLYFPTSVFAPSRIDQVCQEYIRLMANLRPGGCDKIVIPGNDPRSA